MEHSCIVKCVCVCVCEDHNISNSGSLLYAIGERSSITPLPFFMQALKAAFTEQAASVTAVQQDVSEFTHKLLEWIEIAFKTAAGNNELVLTSHSTC